MFKVFYRYASGRAENPLVDKHDIQQALSAWSWYWTFLEGLPITVLAASVSLYLNSEASAKFFAAWFLIYSILLSFQYKHLERYARPQIETIADNQEAATAVRGEFNAL